MPNKFAQGFTAGVVSTGLTHPLDTLRTFQQVSGSSIGNSLKTIAENGMLKGFYRGGLINCMSMGTFYSVFFPVNQYLQRVCHIESEFQRNFLCGYAAGMVGSFVGNPLYVFKIRQQGSLVKTGVHGHLMINDRLPSLTNIASDIYRSRGIKGFFSGYNMTFIRNLDLGVLMVINEYLRKNDTNLFLAGFVAKSFSSFTTYPSDTIRTLVRNGNSDSYLSTLKTLLKTDGVRGLYRGYLAYAVRSVPASAITFGVYGMMNRR